MKSKKVKIIAIVGGVLLIAVFGFSRLKTKATVSDIDQMSRSEVEYTVAKGNISVSVTGSGSINPTDKRVIKSEIDGTVDGIYVTEGDTVEKDQVLISLKADSSDDNQTQINDIDLNIEKAQKELNELYENQGRLSIYAEESGIVSDLSIEAGDKVNADSVIGKIKDTDNSYIEAYFTKEQFDKISIGDEASVFMNKYLTTQTGTVTDKDSTPIQMGGGTFGYKVTVKMTNPGGYSVGDSARVTVTNSQGTYNDMENGFIIDIKEKNIVSKISGEVKSVSAEDGKYVNKGDIIAVLEGDDLELEITEIKNQIEKYKSQLDDLAEGDTVYSPIKGTVLQVDVSEEEVVDRTTTLMTVADLDKMEVILAVDELDISKIHIGQQAVITSEVFENESYTGKVTKISLEGANQSGVTTYDVTIQLDDRKSLMSGMNVDVEIFSEKKDNVLIVPIDAVHKINGEYMVTVKDASGNKSDVKVELGLATEEEVEITSGLNDGDIIVYSKIQTQSNNMNMPNGGTVMRVPGGNMGGGGMGR